MWHLLSMIKCIDVILATLQTAVVTETKEKDRLKKYWCSLETLKVLFVRDERSKLQLHLFLPRPRRVPKGLHVWFLDPTRIHRSTATFSDRPNWFNYLTAQSPCLYILSSHQLIWYKHVSLNFSVTSSYPNLSRRNVYLVDIRPTTPISK